MYNAYILLLSLFVGVFRLASPDQFVCLQKAHIKGCGGSGTRGPLGPAAPPRLSICLVGAQSRPHAVLPLPTNIQCEELPLFRAVSQSKITPPSSELNYLRDLWKYESVVTICLSY